MAVTAAFRATTAMTPRPTVISEVAANAVAARLIPAV